VLAAQVPAGRVPLGVALRFLGEDIGIASAARKVSNDGAQQQGDNFDMPQSDVIGSPALGGRVVLVERVQPFLATRAFPRDVDPRQVILANAR
jgi:hypothetical protein